MRLGTSSKQLFSTVRWILAVQLLVIALVSLSMLALVDWPAAKSALLGGMAAFIPNVYFAVKFGRTDEARTAQDVVGAFYLGETIKLITTAVLFGLIFQLPDIRFLPLFAGFVPVLAVFWFALLMRGTA